MWVFMLPDGRAVRQEIFTVRGRAATVMTRTLDGPNHDTTLDVRPFLSGRDPHATHHENAGFRFDPDRVRDLLLWHPYPSVPSVAVKANGAYTHAPEWYRQFLYEAERARGLDDTEDLAAPGCFTWNFKHGPAVFILASPTPGEDYRDLYEAEATAVAAKWRKLEQARRGVYASAVQCAADDYIVRRGAGHTILAGYPWFTDWGRDTFIALRGLCLATGRLAIARSILIEWSGIVSEGMLPNFFPDGAARPEYNSVDASLWFVVAVHDYLAARVAAGRPAANGDLQRLIAAVAAILQGYSRGTRFNIRADEDGLLLAGQPGVQLTWMDAKVGDWVVTPRVGKPVEVQALWINALRIAGKFSPEWGHLAERALASFHRKFWNVERSCLYDVIDVDFQPGRVDTAVRPNQIFAVGGLPFALLDGAKAASVVRVVEEKLLTPLGLRSLEPGHPDYKPRYTGGVRERDGAYHQGTVWPWLMGPFVEAWLYARDRTPAARAEANKRFLTPLRAHLETAGLGHISEVADGDAPHHPGGCPFQAWSLGEFLRIEALLK
ncbi:MAG: glycogen debranching enzyme N-terminal domain-containing protein [Verrucomicrobia bacterium]|nr:glycogen debranching enzyme N-terminal domain-containing protein [Verrucomicrobiota bacterium]